MRRIILFILLSGLFLSSYNRTPSHQIVINNVVEEVIEDTIPTLNRENLKAELIKRNIPCYNIVLAQAILETGNFTSKHCKERNNIFGMRSKKGYKYYNSWIECVDDYEQKFSKRYKGGDYFQFLRKVCYAEAPDYEQRVRRLI